MPCAGELELTARLLPSNGCFAGWFARQDGQDLLLTSYSTRTTLDIRASLCSCTAVAFRRCGMGGSICPFYSIADGTMKATAEVACYIENKTQADDRLGHHV